VHVAPVRADGEQPDVLADLGLDTSKPFLPRKVACDGVATMAASSTVRPKKVTLLSTALTASTLP
jgi:hypothetical protein